MRTRGSAIAAIAALLLGTVCLLAYSRGPEGCTTAKDVELAVEDASEDVGLKLAEVRSVQPDQIRLPDRIAIKHWLKRVTSASGVTLPRREYATVYLVQSADGARSARCSVRVTGDHVLAIVVSHEAGPSDKAARFRGAMAKRLPGCAVVEKA